MLRTIIGGIVATIFTTTAPLAQTITTLYLEGDAIPGGGTVDRVLHFDVNDSGDWIVALDSVPGSGVGFVVIRSGVELVRSNDAVPGYPGATFVSPSTITSLDENGRYTASILADIPTIGVDGCLVENGTILLLDGTAVNAPGAPPGAEYEQFLSTLVGDRANEFLVKARLDVGAPPNENMIVRFTVDLGIGLLDEEFVVKPGDLLPGQTDPVLTVTSSDTDMDYNRSGQTAFVVQLDGSTATDYAIYLDNLLVAQEGGPTGLAVENWELLNRASLDLNDRGQLAFTGTTDAGDQVVMFDGRLICREGDLIPTASGLQPNTGFPPLAPVYCSESGDVLYASRWNEAGFGSRQCLMVNDQALVIEDATTIGGQLVTDFYAIYNTFRMSNTGRYVIFGAELGAGLEGVFLVDRGERPINFCAGDGLADAAGPATPCPCANESATGAREGCENSTGKGAFVAARGSLRTVLGDTTFALNQAPPNQPGLLVQGTVPIRTPFKDGIFCMGTPTERVQVVFTDSTGYAETSGDIAASVGAGPGDAYGYQFWYRNPGGSPCGTGSNFTQAIFLFWQ